jgi:hypothetical protein
MPALGTYLDRVNPYHGGCNGTIKYTWTTLPFDGLSELLDSSGDWFESRPDKKAARMNERASALENLREKLAQSA